MFSVHHATKQDLMRINHHRFQCNHDHILLEPFNLRYRVISAPREFFFSCSVFEAFPKTSIIWHSFKEYSGNIYGHHDEALETNTLLRSLYRSVKEYRTTQEMTCASEYKDAGICNTGSNNTSLILYVWNWFSIVLDLWTEKFSDHHWALYSMWYSFNAG